MLKKTSLSVLLFLFSNVLLAQNAEPEMADLLRSNGKIFVVVAVLAIIFCLIIVYLFMLDRKISVLENKLKDQTK